MFWSKTQQPRKEAQPAARAQLAISLEPRMLFDGAVAATVADAAASSAPPPTDTAHSPAADDSAQQASDAVMPPAATSDQRQEVVFIDGKVDNQQQLIAGLKPGTEVVVLDSSKDGLQQIADYLKGRSDVDAIHLLSHGADGTVELGNTWLNAQNIGLHSQALNAIGAAMASDGDILIYGCDTGEGAQGSTLFNELARLTQADVAGSVDLTGAADKGGDWQLERQTGQIEAATLNLVDYRSLLATPADQNFDTQALRYLDNAGETIGGITYSMLLPTAGSGAAMTITDAPAFINITGPSDQAIMFNFDGVIMIGGPVDARMASADGSAFRLVSMEIDTGTSLNTTSKLIIRGYRDGVAVASDTLDTAASDSAGSVTYTKNGIANGFGGTLTFSSAWQNIDEIRITGTDTVIVVDDLKFAAAVLSTPAPVLTTSGGSTAFVEGNNVTSTPVAIDPSLTLSDPDSPTLNSAKVVISGNFQAGEDSLGFSPNAATMGDITGNYNASTGTLTLTSSGGASAAQWQAALRSVTYTNSSDTPNASSRTVSFSINDGTNESATVTRPVTITAVDDAPLINAPASTQVVEDIASVINQIHISDADSANIYMTLSVTSGTLTATSGAGVVVSGNSSTLNLSGTIAAVNAFIANNRVTYITAANASADVTLTVGVDTGSVSTDTKTITLTVTPVNDAPVVTVPGNITVVEDVPGALTGISFSDADAGSGSVTVTFSVPSGTLSAVSGSGVTVSDSGTATLTLSGTVSDINAFIAAASVKYQTALDNTISVQLRVSINDNGNTGGSAQIDTKTVTIKVTAVNDAPVNSVPPTQSMSNNGVLAFNTAHGNAISISDVDAGSSLMIVTLSSVNGTMSLSPTSGVTLLIGSGQDNAVMHLEGTQADINSTLLSLTFKPNSGYTGIAELTIQSNDQSNTGSGGAKSDIDTITINVTSPNPMVNDVTATGPNGNGPYKVGDTITVAVEFDQTVYVNGGTPSLLLETGSTDRIATYVGGSGSHTLTFSYTVQAGDSSADLDYVSTSALSLNGGTIQDGANQSAILTLAAPGTSGSLGANQALVVDGVRPAATSITLNDTALRIGETATLTVTFNEQVSGLDIADFSVANGSLSGLSSSNGGLTWTATFTPSANISDATNLITLDNTGVMDLAGNIGSGSTNSASYAVDTQRPTATIVVSDTSLKAGQTTTVTITFTEAVTGLGVGDFLVDNGNLSGLSSSDGGITWTATLTPSASVTDTSNLVTLDNTGVQDLAGNAGTSSTDSNNYGIDTQRPTVTIVVTDTTLKGGQSTTVTITFSEAVTGLGTADFSVANGTLSNLSSSDGGLTWTATLTPDADVTDATNLITLDNTGYTDAAGNTGTGTADSNNYAIDSKAPTVTSVGVPANGTYIAGDTLDFTVNFDEAVTVDTTGGIPRLAITLDTGGTVYANYVSGSGSSVLVFRLTVASGQMDSNGISLDSSIDANNGTLRDSAGNNSTPTLNAVGSTTGVLVDAVAPQVSAISLDSASPTNASSVTFTVTFSENVSGVDLGDFSLLTTGSANGNLISQVQLSANTYRITVDNVSGLGNLGLALAANGSGIVDANNNALAASFSTPGYAVGTPTPPPTPSGDPQLMAYPTVTAPPPTAPLPPVSEPGMGGSDFTSPLLPPPLFEVRTIGGDLPPLGTIFLGNGSSAPSFIAQVFGSSDTGLGGTSGFLGFGGGDGGVFGSSTLAGIFSKDVPGVSEMNVFAGTQWKQSDLNQGLRGVFGVPTFGQQLHDLHEGKQRQVRELAQALGQLGSAQPQA